MNQVEMVKMICKERNISIHKLEMDCGFANGYISQLRKGVFPMDRAVKIADYLGLKIDYFVDDLFIESERDYKDRIRELTSLSLAVPVSEENDMDEELVEYFNKLPEHLRKSFLDLVKTTAKEYADKT